jgi:hypothetical protein
MQPKIQGGGLEEARRSTVAELKLSGFHSLPYEYL